MQKIRRRKFGEILVAEGLISREILQETLQRQQGSGMTVGEILLADGIITETDIVRCVCSQYQLPFIRTVNYQYDTGMTNAFGPEFCYKNRLVPLDRIGDCVILAVAEIPDEHIEKQLIDAVGCEVYYYVAPTADVENTLRKHFQLGQDKMLALDEQRRSERAQHQLGAHARSASRSHSSSGVTDSTQNKLLQSLDASWEVIFDEAEKNVNDR